MSRRVVSWLVGGVEDDYPGGPLETVGGAGPGGDSKTISIRPDNGPGVPNITRRRAERVEGRGTVGNFDDESGTAFSVHLGSLGLTG